jgi:hypothetical protein
LQDASKIRSVSTPYDGGNPDYEATGNQGSASATKNGTAYQVTGTLFSQSIDARGARDHYPFEIDFSCP